MGSCWAFSTVEIVEGQWAMAGSNLTSLSAEQLVDCDATYDPDKYVMNEPMRMCCVRFHPSLFPYPWIQERGSISFLKCMLCAFIRRVCEGVTKHGNYFTVIFTVVRKGSHGNLVLSTALLLLSASVSCLSLHCSVIICAIRMYYSKLARGMPIGVPVSERVGYNPRSPPGSAPAPGVSVEAVQSFNIWKSGG